MTLISLAFMKYAIALVLAAASCGFATPISAPLAPRQAAVTPSNTGTSVTLIFQNNLNYTDDSNHIGALLLDPMPYSNGSSACQALGESLISSSTLQSYSADFVYALSYLSYAGYVNKSQTFYVSNKTLTYTQSATGANAFIFQAVPSSSSASYPILCTQSVTTDSAYMDEPSATDLITVQDTLGNLITGYRNLKSFRFLGIPFANKPDRWTYSQLYSQSGQVIQATQYGNECPQGTSGNEDCLNLNIQTPYIPKYGSTKNLRPVLFWIYGGGYVGGANSDFSTDGGQLCSREDVVVVQVNYRLTTLGFLAVPGTYITGNYGIGDQITGLQWVIKNIALFGGDPTRITIAGESAGAASVKALLGSPLANGKFAGAIAMSNLGGGKDLGLTSNYGTTYSSYLTVQQSYDEAGQYVFSGTGCNVGTTATQIACLKALPAVELTELATAVRFIVQDGTIINTPYLSVGTKNPNVSHVPVIFGNTRDDGASFCGYNTTAPTFLSALASNLAISSAEAQAIVSSGLFPSPSTGNVTADAFNVSARVATDTTFRCVDQAIAYAGATSGAFKTTYYYQMERTDGGFNPNNVDGTGPVSTAYPNGNPEQPYWRLHGSDLPWLFGTLYPLREPQDLYGIQLSTAYFSSFIRSGNPNPVPAYLKIRGYNTTIAGVAAAGTWGKVASETGPIQHMDWPARGGVFVDTNQCAWLNYSVAYYRQGAVLG